MHAYSSIILSLLRDLKCIEFTESIVSPFPQEKQKPKQKKPNSLLAKHPIALTFNSSRLIEFNSNMMHSDQMHLYNYITIGSAIKIIIKPFTSSSK